MRHDCIAAARAAVRPPHRLEDVLRRQRAAFLALQLVREHVEQHFGIRIGVDVAAVLADQHLARSSSVLIRLPLCAEAMPYGELT